MGEVMRCSSSSAEGSAAVAAPGFGLLRRGRRAGLALAALGRRLVLIARAHLLPPDVRARRTSRARARAASLRRKRKAPPPLGRARARVWGFRSQAKKASRRARVKRERGLGAGHDLARSNYSVSCSAAVDSFFFERRPPRPSFFSVPAPEVSALPPFFDAFFLAPPADLVRLAAASAASRSRGL